MDSYFSCSQNKIVQNVIRCCLVCSFFNTNFITTSSKTIVHCDPINPIKEHYMMKERPIGGKPPGFCCTFVVKNKSGVKVHNYNYH